MAPRKKAKTARPASPTPPSQPEGATPAENSPDKADEQLLNDPWTDEEETGLFKGLIHWKPTGIHKHFRLLSLHQFMLQNGYIHPQNEHTKPAGIWRKLQTLYNLDALDEREDARQLEKIDIPAEYRESADDEDDSDDSSDDADVYSVAENKIENQEFNLIGENFDELKWERRLAREEHGRDDSPPLFPELNFADAPPVSFTPSFSIEPSETATPRPRRGGRGRGRAGAASTRGRPTAGRGASNRRSTRKGGSVTDDGEQEQEDEDEGGDEEEAEEDEDEDTSEEEESASTARPTRGGRRAKTGRAAANNKPRPRGRTRGK